jgi:hypothetical protein
MNTYTAYRSAGADYLAVRLTRIFTKIETEEDRVLHNDMVLDVLTIIKGGNHAFLKGLAEDMLFTKVDRKKRFFVRLAKRILNWGMRK